MGSRFAAVLVESRKCLRMTTSMSLKDFLKTVDSNRDGDFVEKVLPLLAEQDITVPAHLAEQNPQAWKFATPISGGVQHFFREAVRKYNANNPAFEEGEVPEKDDHEAMQLAFMKAFGMPRVNKLVEVDLEGELKKLGLADLFPFDFWPQLNAVRELMSQKGKPFVCADLRKFLPKYCPEFTPVVLDDNGAVDHSATSRGPAKRVLEYSTWQMSWDTHALALAVAGQLGFSDAMKHKLVIQQLAIEAAAEDRRPIMAVLYDGHVRRFWEDRKSVLKEKFVIANVVEKVDDKLLRLAKRDYDLMFGPKPSSEGAGPVDRVPRKRTASAASNDNVLAIEDSAPKKSKGREHIQCFICKQYGHYSSKCPNKKSS